MNEVTTRWEPIEPVTSLLKRVWGPIEPVMSLTDRLFAGTPEGSDGASPPGKDAEPRL